MIHIQTWSGSRTARVTDMTNASKRGKTCQVLRFMGFPGDWHRGKPEMEEAHRATFEILGFLDRCDRSRSFGEIAGTIKGLIELAHKAGAPDTYVNAYDEQIKGIDAPREVLTAGVDGKWSASVDETGVTLDELCDSYNMPAMITPHDQRGTRAYDLARKVWDRVTAAASFSEAGEILRGAGCKLHYYCRMD